MVPRISIKIFVLIMIALVAACDDYSSAEQDDQDSSDPVDTISLAVFTQNNAQGEFAIELPVTSYEWSDGFEPTRAVVQRSVSEPEMYGGTLTRQIIFSVDIYNVEGSVPEYQSYNLAKYRILVGNEDSLLDGFILQSSCDDLAYKQLPANLANKQALDPQDYFFCIQSDKDTATNVINGGLNNRVGYVIFQTNAFYSSTEDIIGDSASIFLMLTLDADGQISGGYVTYISDGVAPNYMRARSGA